MDASEDSTDPNTPVYRKWCFTSETYVKFQYTWTLDNFLSRAIETGQILESSRFWIPGVLGVRWNLYVYPNGQNEDNKNFVGLFLKAVKKTDYDTLWAKGEFSILNSKGEKRIVLPLDRQNFVRSPAWGCVKFVSREQLSDAHSDLLHDGQLTVACEVYVEKNSLKNSILTTLAEPEVQNNDLAYAIKTMFEDQILTDVTFNVDGCEISAHRALLSARSTVFAAMFRNHFVESKTGVVEITDVSHDSFAEMIHFIYTDTSPKLDKLAYDLVKVTEKYNITMLKNLAETNLIKTLTIDRACELLVLSEMHNAQRLKFVSLDFIRNNYPEVRSTEGWNMMKQTNPSLAIEVFDSLF